MKILNWFKSLVLGRDKCNRSALEMIQEQIKVECFWRWKIRQPEVNKCNSFHSNIAVKQFGIDSAGAANAIIGYVEFLEKENATLKANNAMVQVSDGVYTHKGKLVYYK